MKQLKRRKLSTLAVAIGLACGGTALADDSTDKELSPTYGQETVQAPSTTDQDSKYDSEYDNMDDPVSQPSATDRSASENMAPEMEPAESSSGEQETRESYAATAGERAGFLDENIQSENDISEFAAAVEKAGLADALASGTEYTIFAPTDEAFQAYTDENGEVQVEELREVIRTHIVSGTVDAEQAKSLDSAQVLTGETVTIAQDGDKLAIGDATIVSADIRSGNLTIHTIDAVLAPDAGDSWQARDAADSAQESGAESTEELPDEEEAE